MSNLTGAGKGVEELSKGDSAWNLKMEGGWKEFKKETEAVAEKVKDTVEDETLSVEECMGKINAIENKVKFKSFGKTRKTQVSKKLIKVKKCSTCSRLEGQRTAAPWIERRQSGGLEAETSSTIWMEGEQAGGLGGESSSTTRMGICDECNTNEDKDEILLKKQGDKLEKEINDIKVQGKGRLTRSFRMKQKVLGGKKAGMEPSAIRDPSSGDLMVSSADIKKTTLQYCVDNLKNNTVSKSVEVIQK